MLCNTFFSPSLHIARDPLGVNSRHTARNPREVDSGTDFSRQYTMLAQAREVDSGIVYQNFASSKYRTKITLNSRNCRGLLISRRVLYIYVAASIA